jgi:hypothetical protein
MVSLWTSNPLNSVLVCALADLLYNNDVPFILRLWSDTGSPAIGTGGQLLPAKVIMSSRLTLSRF